MGKHEEESKEITLTLPDGSTLPSTAPSFKAMPPIRSVLTMPKIAEEEWETLHEKEEEIYEEEGERESLKMTCNRNDSVEEERRVRPRRRNESETFPLHQLGSRTLGLQSNLSTPHLRPSWSWTRRESQVSQIQGLDLKMSASSARLPRPMSRKDVFYTGSIINMVEEEPGDTLRNNVASYVSLGKGSNVLMPRDSLVFAYKEAEEAQEEEKHMMQIILSMMNTQLLKDPKFILICVSNVFGFLGFYVPFIYLPSLASSHPDITSKQAALLLSVIGISNTFGRILTGWMSDLPRVDSLVVVSSSLLLSSLCVFLLPTVSTYYMLLVLGSLFGLTIAAYISLTSIVLVDLMGLENLTSSFGLLTMFRGAASIVGPPIAGSVYAATDSLNISFYLAGAFLLTAGLTSSGAYILRWTQNRLDIKQRTEETNT